MNCIYRFAVDCRIRPDVHVPIPARGWLFEFQTTNGFVTQIEVTVPVPNEADWPSVSENPRAGTKLRIDPKTPHLPEIQQHLRNLQGLLALYGLRSIELEHPEVEWVPESDEESSKLALHSFSMRRESLPDDQIHPTSFDLLARSVLAAGSASEVEIPLNFFRRGMLDVYSRNYIEAFYDFFFILESEFAEGKFHQRDVLIRFQRSSVLRASVERAIGNPSLMLRENAIRERFAGSYANMNVDEALARIVERRGFFHHHTKKDMHRWHPEDQLRYEVDALFLQSVALNVVMGLARPFVSDSDVVSQYEALAKRTRGTA
jgi:hypothetical protein